MASFHYSFTTYTKHYWRFRSKELSSQKTFLISKFVIDAIISNCTSRRTIQEEIVFVISDRPRGVRSLDFEIARSMTPWIVLHFTRYSFYYFTHMLRHQHKEMRWADERLLSSGCW